MQSEEDAEIVDRVTALLNEVEARLEEGYADEGLQIALQCERLLGRHPRLEAADLRIDTHYLLASCYFDLRDVPASLRQYERVRELDAKDPEIGYWHARALFHCWRFEEADALLENFRANPETRAATYYYRALLQDFAGRDVSADRWFAKAEAENPEEFPRPVRLESAVVEEMLADTVRDLPQDLQDVLRDIRVELTTLPDPRRFASPDLDPLVLGLCRRRGVAHVAQRAPEAENRIILFQRNLERVSGDADELREEIRQTLLHEIGHHLDWNREQGHSHGLN